MSNQEWIFVIGFRVFDVGLLVLWIAWFLRRRGQADDPPQDEGGGGGGGERPRPGPKGGPGDGGIPLPGGRWPIGTARLRDGHRTRTAWRSARRRLLPSPVRVRVPGSDPARVLPRR